ncbi:EamA family transporter [Sporomusa malonica]|uniref:EamA-like transporter family protein n=1 Tax=Sporomusa malonica TaxID=112901 RepID=A0A1W2DYP0_9FIRM|nr:EamA family transporter [Sporomusa malonica]SMD02559.1 EamA-like transporter family protein [Sporomusa malonica]
MNSFALLLVVTAAFCHAAWNLLAKRACGGTAFIWIFASLSALLYFPLALWVLLIEKPNISTYQIVLILGSAVLHSVYFILLDKGYRFGDLSVIYPLARGTGPLLSIVTAILFLGEQPTPIALAGAILIGIGILVITGNPFSHEETNARKSIVYALFCGATIAGYTVVDKIAVSTYLIPPLLMDWSTNLGRVILLTPYSLKNWTKVKEQWTAHKKEAIAVAILSPLAYILVLTAMVFSPVSYIAPAREVSILIGTILGAKLLSESDFRSRLVGAGTMLIGLVALSIG